MKREIKFRFWDIKGKFMRGDGPFNLHEISCNVQDIGECLSNEKPVEIMQYTGLKDKNGVEIYEGDLVTFGNWEPGKWKIGWNEDLARFDLFWVGGGEEGWMTLCDAEEDAKQLGLLVIGNVWEHPDLLKQEGR